MLLKQHMKELEKHYMENTLNRTKQISWLFLLGFQCMRLIEAKVKATSFQLHFSICLHKYQHSSPCVLLARLPYLAACPLHLYLRCLTPVEWCWARTRLMQIKRGPARGRSSRSLDRRLTSTIAAFANLHRRRRRG